MPKNQHGKDKMYLTASEWKALGGKKKRRVVGYKRLPFYCCALTLQPFTTPVASPSGYTYDFVHVVPYVKEHGTDPATGEKISIKDLVHLNFSKNSLGKFHDPVSYKEFTDNTHMVAIRTSGNVYSYETVKSLNIVPNNWKDLLTQEAFTRDDIIELQNPEKLKVREYENFAHMQLAIKKRKNDASIRTSSTADKILLKAKKLNDERQRNQNQKSTTSNSDASKTNVKSRFTTGNMAASFTSTAVTPETKNVLATADSTEINEDRWRELRALRKKGYAQIVTNMGQLNLELHFDACPAACENFITLAQKGYYNGTIFHRLIPGFMIQGGDPTGTGRGGESIWGKPFKDEIQTKYTHSERGVLSMANSGKNTNRSQFFISFAPCPHLDKKHTVFGKIVGGVDSLDRIEATSTDPHDRPLEEIKIQKVLVFVNPVEDLAKHKQQEIERTKKEEEEERSVGAIEAAARERKKKMEDAKSRANGGVGRYLQIPKPKSIKTNPSVDKKLSKTKHSQAWSFDSW